VKLIKETEAGIFAAVSGASVYAVSFERTTGGGFIATCNCPVKVMCKHAAAAIHAVANGEPVLGASGDQRPDGKSKPPKAMAKLKAGAKGQKETTSSGAKAPLESVKLALDSTPETVKEAIPASLAIPLREVVSLYEIYSAEGRRNPYHWATSAPRALVFSRPNLALMPPGVTGFGEFVVRLWQLCREPESWLVRLAKCFDADEELLNAWAAECEVALWVNQFAREQAMLEPIEEVLSPVRVQLRLRLRLGTVAQLWISTEEGPFRRMSSETSRSLQAAVDSGEMLLSGLDLLLFQAFRRVHQYGHFTELELSHGARGAIAQLMSDPSMRPLLEGEDGTPLEWSTERLVWSVSEEERHYVWVLRRPDGSSFQKPSWFYGKRNFVQDGNTVWEARFVGAEKLDKYRIPKAAIEQSEGLAYLARHGLPVPPSLSERILQIPLMPRFECRLGVLPDATEFIEIRLYAVSPDRSVSEQYSSKGGWRLHTPLPSAQGRTVQIRRPLHAAALAHLDKLNVPADPTDPQVFFKRLTRELPQVLSDWARSAPAGIEIVAAGELAGLVKETPRATVTIDVDPAGIDWFDVKVRLSVPDLEFTREQLEILIKARGKFVRLDGHGWQRLEIDLDDDRVEGLSRMGIDPLDFSNAPQRLHALQLRDEAGKQELAPNLWETVSNRVKQIETSVKPEVPSELHATLRPYQVEGFHFLAYLSRNRLGGILADDMGLGKTLQTLAWLLWLRGEYGGSHGTSLVVCPKSVVDVWMREAARFAPEMTVVRYVPRSGKTVQDIAATAELIVMNYAQLRGALEESEQVTWRSIVLDEAQNIKNPDSLSATAARSLKAEHRLALTGTPIENRLLDLWSIMAFAMPGALGNRRWFTSRFDKAKDSFSQSRLAARVRPFLIRRTKAQVASDLPERVEEEMYCQMDGAQLSLYKAELKLAQALLLKSATPSDFNKNRFSVLQQLLRLRQICCHPALVSPSEKKAESAKLSALLEMLETLREEGAKALVFSQFTSVLDLIETELKERGWEYLMLTGKTENRQELVAEFQSSEKPLIFLLSLKAAGAGLTLTSAQYVFLYDPWWNPAVEAQAIDRTHRIGQTSKVIAYRLIVKESIEEKIRLLQQSKRSLVENVLGDEALAEAVTLEDVQFLLSDG
jgi:superfamily II DNA or RNA helicase